MGTLSAWAQDIQNIATQATFKGALLKLTANKSIANGTATDITWDAAVYDVGGWFNTANPTRLTVPAGVSRVILSTNVIWAVNSSGSRFLSHYKNGPLGRFVGEGSLRHPAIDNAELNISSAVVDVVAGDFFVSNVYQTSGVALNILAEQSSWFCIRAA